ncbi:MAG: hypothetical protein AAFY65_16070, partial [Pseudomonadota bacterium]
GWWYRNTLFLDYRDREMPRVGFVDFDCYRDLPSGAWEAEAHWWDDFDSFFADLRRDPDDLAQEEVRTYPLLDGPRP